MIKEVHEEDSFRVLEHCRHDKFLWHWRGGMFPMLRFGFCYRIEVRNLCFTWVTIWAMNLSRSALMRVNISTEVIIQSCLGISILGSHWGYVLERLMWLCKKATVDLLLIPSWKAMHRIEIRRLSMTLLSTMLTDFLVTADDEPPLREEGHPARSCYPITPSSSKGDIKYTSTSILPPDKQSQGKTPY